MSSFLNVSLLNTCVSKLNKTDWDSMKQFKVHDEKCAWNQRKVLSFSNLLVYFLAREDFCISVDSGLSTLL